MQTEDRDLETGQFVKGKKGGPGRPKGSRNKLGEAFIADLYDDWQENGPATIQAVRTEKPDAYLKVIASILPRDLNVNVNPLGDLTDEQLVERIRRLNDLIGPYLAVEGARLPDERTGSQTAH